MSLQDPLGNVYYSSAILKASISGMISQIKSEEDMLDSIIRLIRTVEDNAYTAGRMEIQCRIKSALEIE